MEIKAVLDKVALIQSQIQHLPDSKKRHYFDNYLKVGETSRLNLIPGRFYEPLRKSSVLTNAGLSTDHDMSKRYVRLDIQSQGNNSVAVISQDTVADTQQDFKGHLDTIKHQTEPNFFDLT